MPPAAIAAALGVSLLTATVISIGASLAVSIGLSLAVSMLFKPSAPNNFGDSFLNSGSGRTQQFRQPIAAQQIVYGRVRVSGPLVFVGASESNKFLHMVLPLAAHEIDGWECVYLDDYVIYPDDLNSGDTVFGGRYMSRVTIQFHNGTDDQTAESRLVDAFDEWTSDHRGRGIAYLYIRLLYNRDVFATGVPKISAVIRGKKVHDPRDDSTRWTQNAALCLSDYLQRSTKLGGVGAASTEIDEDSLIAAANACDEFPATREVSHSCVQSSGVDAADDHIEFTDDALLFQIGDRVTVSSTGTLPGGLLADTNYYVIVRQHRFRDNGTFDANLRIQLASTYENAEAGTAIDITSTGSGTLTVTKNAEPRYTANGMFKTDTTPIGQHVADLASAMAGHIIYSGGVFRFKAGVWEDPSVTFDESHFRAAIRTPTKRSRRERFNAVRGNYSSPLNNWQPQPYPTVTNSNFETEDNGERVYTTLELPFTSRANTAQRIGNIHLFRNRNQIGVDAPLNLAGLQVRPGNVIALDNDVRGWSGKSFEVVSWKLSVEGGDNPVMVTDLTLVSSDSTDYDFDPDLDEQLVDPTPDTTLPDPFTVAAPTGLATASERIDTESGDGTYKITVSWTPSEDFFVLEDGRYEVQFKLTSVSTWRESFSVPGDQDSADLYQVRLGEAYDVRIRAVNHIGVRSSFSTLTNFSVLNPGGAGTTFDWGTIIDSVDDSEDWGLITDGAGSPTTDWGTIT